MVKDKIPLHVVVGLAVPGPWGVILGVVEAEADVTPDLRTYEFKLVLVEAFLVEAKSALDLDALVVLLRVDSVNEPFDLLRPRDDAERGMILGNIQAADSSGLLELVARLENPAILVGVDAFTDKGDGFNCEVLARLRHRRVCIEREFV
jgi:hypothetical protein